MFSVHQQTIRLYERMGLIAPERSDGNTRLFSDEDINRLEEVIYLTHELGINLAGVDMILKLKKQISRLQKNMNKAFETTQKELDKKVETARDNVQTNAQRLMQLRQQRIVPTAIAPSTTIVPAKVPEKDRDGQWQIDYENE